MISLRTHIPALIFMLADRGVELTFKKNEQGDPILQWDGPGFHGCAYLEKGDAYGARAIQLERELIMLCAEGTAAK